MVDHHTISAVVPFIVARVTASIAAVDLASVLGSAGSEAGPRADEHVDVRRYLEVWRRALQHVPDPAFPLRAAASMQLEDSEVFGFLAMSCENLGEAYDKSASYRALFSIGSGWELEIDENSTRVIWYPWPGDIADVAYRAAMDFAMVDMTNAVRRLARNGQRPTAVRLRHSAPKDAAFYIEHFGVAPTFGTPLYELVYPPGLRDMPIASFNSRLRDYFDEQCRALTATMGSGSSLIGQVRKVLIAAMGGGDTTIEATAKTLAMSSRSLQRRLAEEGTRYNDLLAEVRAEFAKRYLADGTISASEVAYLIGFTEPPAFFKAFKRWTGMTPRAFQQKAS